MGFIRDCFIGESTRLIYDIMAYTDIENIHGLLMLIDFDFIYLFWVLCRFQHCTGDITTGSWKGRGNQYIEFVRVLYCKLPTNGKQLPAFPHKALTGIEPWPQRWEARVVTTLPPWPPHRF